MKPPVVFDDHQGEFVKLQPLYSELAASARPLEAPVGQHGLCRSLLGAARALELRIGLREPLTDALLAT